MQRPRPTNQIPTSWRERVAGSFWFVPFLCLAAATGLAIGLIEVDQRLVEDGGATLGFAGGADASREILSTIASSTLTLAGLVFSITVLVLQLTSTQFSPRALRTFLRDRRTQLSLGVFLSTFFYALVALREVRGGDSVETSFVPGVTITGAFALVVLSVATFVYYIHHIAQSIRVVSIIERIGKETGAAIERLYPEGERAEPPAPPPSAFRTIITSGTSGVVADVAVPQLVEECRRGGWTVEVIPAVGEFVPRGSPLLRVSGGEGEIDDGALKGSVLLQAERTMDRDPLYGFRQLVDIAEKALSPGFNDPSTATQCLDQIHDLLRRLAGRQFPTGRHTDDQGVVRVVVPTPSWTDFVHLGLDEIRHWGAGSLQIHRRIRVLIDDLLTVVAPDRRAPLLHQQQLLDARSVDLPETERNLVASS